MSIDNLVTVIPMTKAALNSVNTPYVAFQQSWPERPARLVRQIEAMQRYYATIMLGDVWPDSHHDTLNWTRARQLLEQYPKQQERWSTSLWPETAVYCTNLAKLLGVNENIRYRPQLWLFCQYFERCGLINLDDIEVSPEGVIYVADRNIYPVSYPKLQLKNNDSCDLTIIVVGNIAELKSVLPKNAEIILMPEQTGAAFNIAIEQASGKFIAVCLADTIYNPDRFKIQLEFNADVVLSTVETADSIDGWSIRGYTSVTDKPTQQLGTFMFRRAIFERLAGACAELSCGFDYDLFVRIVASNMFNLAYIEQPLMTVQANIFTDGIIYTQQVYNDAANRIRNCSDYHAMSIKSNN